MRGQCAKRPLCIQDVARSPQLEMCSTCKGVEEMKLKGEIGIRSRRSLNARVKSLAFMLSAVEAGRKEAETIWEDKLTLVKERCKVQEDQLGNSSRVQRRHWLWSLTELIPFGARRGSIGVGNIAVSELLLSEDINIKGFITGWLSVCKVTELRCLGPEDWSVQISTDERRFPISQISRQTMSAQLLVQPNLFVASGFEWWSWPVNPYFPSCLWCLSSQSSTPQSFKNNDTWKVELLFCPCCLLDTCPLWVLVSSSVKWACYVIQGPGPFLDPTV